jgi:hypothetical protein
MTRINCIPPAELHDRHLLAEYRELPRVFALARPVSDAPQHYALGKGHVKFFYDKLLYLANRQRQIIAECLHRGFNIQYRDVCTDGFDSRLMNDWQPDAQAMELNRQRIKERLTK